MATNAPEIIAIVGAFVGCAVLVVALRVLVRSLILKTFGLDDYMMVGSTLCAIVSLICFIEETKHGVGMHNRDIPNDQMVIIKHWVFWHNIFVTGGISLVKISVACFLTRLVPQKGHKIFLYCLMVFLVAFTLTCVAILVFSCTPVRASWDNVKDAKCLPRKQFTDIGLFNSCINISTDILFASLPVPIIWKLNANLRTRLSLIGVLSLGYAACAVAIAKANIQRRFYDNSDSYRKDTYSICNIVELCVGILAASLPALRPLFRGLLETTKTRDGSRNGDGTGGTSGLGNGCAKRNYYIQGQGIGLNNFPHSATEGKYNARISAKIACKDGSRFHSEEEFPVKEDFPTEFPMKRRRDDGSSAENILQLQGIENGSTNTVKLSL